MATRGNRLTDATAAQERAGSAKGVRKSRKFAMATLAIAAMLVVAAASPLVANALNATPNYSWFVNHLQGEPYVIGSVRDWQGFTFLVNGEADVDGDGVLEPAYDFAGEVVQLGTNLVFNNQKIDPVGGGKRSTQFNGTFDGQGHTLNSFSVDTSGATGNLGVFGYAGPDSAICNVKVGATGKLNIAAAKDDGVSLANIGLLVGYSEGSLLNCESSGSVTVANEADQTLTMPFPILNVGGLGGNVLGDIAGCKNAGTVAVSEPGTPYAVTAEDEKTYTGTSSLAVNIGGVVGCAGTIDSQLISVSSDREIVNVHGVISDCSNTGTIIVDTPAENGTDRFGNPTSATSSNVGGISGYSRASISDCSNSGLLKCDHATRIGGIAGSLRSIISSGSFSEEGMDEGVLMDDAEEVVVANCTNSGIVYGHAFAGGIVGHSGSYTVIASCLNESSGKVYGTRWNKPFTAGIVGATYGVVSYCANLGNALSATHDFDTGLDTTQSGYYTAGIAGGTFFYTDSKFNRVSPMPEIYGNYNAGAVIAQDNFRQRSLVGDNSGYVHDNVALEGTVYEDKLVYGMYEGDTETSGGVLRDNYVVTAAQLKGEVPLDAENDVWVIGLLNAMADADGWLYYWVKSNGSANGGFAVLNEQVSWPATGIEDASVYWKANADYTGLESAPKATVSLADGTVLLQNVDYHVIPQAGAIEVTGGKRAYTASVVGIGAFAGVANQTFTYGIDKGDLANCVVSIDPVKFNWEPQEPTDSIVHVFNAAGVEMDPSEFDYALDPNSKYLTDGQAVNAKRYDVNFTAASDSPHFVGTTTGEFNIDTVKIIVLSKDQETVAYPTGIEYEGTQYDWDSMTLHADDEPQVTLQYTGHSIKPSVVSVVYLGRELSLGKDYRVIYGSGSLVDGGQQEPEGPNVGAAGERRKGYVTVRYVQGGNFENYDNMHFTIDGTDDSRIDINRAVVSGDGDVIFEQGSVYTPIVVSYGGSQLTEGVDYTIVYSNNDRLGQAVYSIAGKGRFKGTRNGTFNLVEGSPCIFMFAVDDTTGTAAITGVKYTGSLDAFDLVIPSEIEQDGMTYTVTSIADGAFGGSSVPDFMEVSGDEEQSAINLSKGKIASVFIPATVTYLGENAFGNTSSDTSRLARLGSVTFEEGSQLSVIGSGAFANTRLQDLCIPASVTSIGNQAFWSCPLKSLTFMSSTESIPQIYYAGTTKLAFRNVKGTKNSPLPVYAYSPNTSVASFVAKIPSTYYWQLQSLSAYDVEVIADGASWIHGSGMALPVSGAGLAQDFTGLSIDGVVVDGGCFVVEGSEATVVTLKASYLETLSSGEHVITLIWSDGEGQATFTVLPEPGKHTVSFDSAGGNAVESQLVADGQMAAEPEAPMYEGFVFGGWIGPDGEAFDFSTPITEDVQLTASWRMATVTVSFDATGGSDVVSQEVIFGHFALEPEAPTKFGYALDAWYSDPDCTQLFDFGTPVTAEMTLYAGWTVQQPSVTVSDAESVYGTPLTLYADVMVPEGGELIACQWYQAASDGAAGVAVADATEPMFTLPETTEPGTYRYYVQVTCTAIDGSATQATSAAAAATVQKMPQQVMLDVAAVSATSNAVVVDPMGVTVAVGDGADVSYGIAEIDDAGAASWQTSPVFTRLVPETIYYVFARVAETAYYATTPSNGVQVTTMEQGQVPNPMASVVSYVPGIILADVGLTEGWEWEDGSMEIEVGNTGYPAVYPIPEGDDADYAPVEGYDAEANVIRRNVPVTVLKGVPEMVATAGGITFGQTLQYSQLSGEASVDGSIAWADSSIAPSVVDSGVTEYRVVFTPDDTDHYVSTEAWVTVEVAPRDASAAQVSADDAVYTGNAVEVANLRVVLDGVTLVEGQDFLLSLDTDGVSVGEQQITATFMGNYAGSAIGAFNVVAHRQYWAEDSSTGAVVSGDDMAAALEQIDEGEPYVDLALSSMQLDYELAADLYDFALGQYPEGATVDCVAYGARLLARYAADGEWSDFAVADGGSIAVTYPYDFDHKADVIVARQDAMGFSIITADPNEMGEYFELDVDNETITVHLASTAAYVIASRQVPDYQITYALAGGANAEENPATYTELDEVVFAEPMREGYDFLRWVDGEANEVTGIARGTTGNIVVTAVWQPIVYQVAYDLDGGVNSGGNPVEYTIEDELSLQEPTKPGYRFVRWVDSQGNTVQGVPAGTTGNISVKAEWELARYQITKNASAGGKVELRSSSMKPEAFTEVVFRTIPDPGKTIVAFNVTYTDPATGERVKLIKDAGLTRTAGTGAPGTISEYSFAMPGTEVTINAVFDDNATKYAIAKKMTGSGKAGSNLMLVGSDGKPAGQTRDKVAPTMYPKAGQTVYFKSVPAKGAKLTKFNVTYSYKGLDGKTVNVKMITGSGIASHGGGLYSFKMPCYNVTLTGEFVKK